MSIELEYWADGTIAVVDNGETVATVSSEETAQALLDAWKETA